MKTLKFSVDLPKAEQTLRGAKPTSRSRSGMLTTTNLAKLRNASYKDFQRAPINLSRHEAGQLADQFVQIVRRNWECV
jgi:hypothetical protein